jgi:urocanate hydratase
MPALAAAACIARIKELRITKEARSIGFLGNIVALWEALAEVLLSGSLSHSFFLSFHAFTAN